MFEQGGRARHTWQRRAVLVIVLISVLISLLTAGALASNLTLEGNEAERVLQPTVPTVPVCDVFLNELLCTAEEVDWNQDGLINSDDAFIELYAAGADGCEVDLSGWVLQVLDPPFAPDSPLQYVIPDGTVLAAGEFLVFFAGDTGLYMDPAGPTVQLLSPDVDKRWYSLEDERDMATCIADRSDARLPDGGQWDISCDPTPWESNNDAECGVPTSVDLSSLEASAEGRTVQPWLYVLPLAGLAALAAGWRLRSRPQ